MEIVTMELEQSLFGNTGTKEMRLSTREGSIVKNKSGSAGKVGCDIGTNRALSRPRFGAVDI